MVPVAIFDPMEVCISYHVDVWAAACTWCCCSKTILGPATSIDIARAAIMIIIVVYFEINCTNGYVERTHPHNSNHITKGSSIHFEFYVVVIVGYDSQVHEHTLLTLEI